MKRFILIAALTAGFTTVFAQNPVTISITDTGGPRINRNIYGQFAEHLGRCVYDGFFRNGKIRMDIVDALKKIKLPLLRWPGGCFADNYHWRDGIGPKANRPGKVNIMWGMVPEDNSFGTSEFLELCSLIGCEPYLAGNVGTGSPEELESWEEYCNYEGTSEMSALRKANGHPEAYHVRFWGIGNESWGCGGRMTPEDYAQQFKTFANYMREYPGSPITRIASGANNDDYNWTEYMMAHISPRWMQGIGVHYYTSIDDTREPAAATNFGEKQYIVSLKNALMMEEIVSKHSAIMDKYDPQKKIALIVDEWGIVTSREEAPDVFYQQNSLRDALIAASTLNIFNNHADRIRMANLAQTVNVLQSLVLTKGDSMLLTPTYYVFDLFKIHQDAHSLTVNYTPPTYSYNNQQIPAVNVSASRDSNGVYHVSLVNLDPTASQQIRLATPKIKSSPQKTSVKGYILTGEKFNDINTFNKPENITIKDFSGIKTDGNELLLTLPPKSVVVVEYKFQ
jgi:alpha-L-arabinofuranosidase